MSPVAPLLEARNLQVWRGGASVLDIPALDLRPGEILALIGPNGAGKTTLMLALAGLLPTAAGTLRFHGTDLLSHRDREAYRRRMTMVFQEPLLFDATVRQNIASGLRLRGISAEARKPVVETWARRFGIEGLLDRSARRLSGGEAQRTALARAFALGPEILFLDEPFSSLDAPSKEGLIEDLGHILGDTGTTAVVATHDQSEAARLADRLAVMKEGRIVQTGSLQEVMNHPEDPFVAAFVGMETLLDGEVMSSRGGLITLRQGVHEVVAVGEAAPGQAILLGIRPENVALSLHSDNASSARNAFPGTVTKVIPWGPFFKVELDCGFFLTTYVTARSLEELALAEGRPVVASFKATAVHVIRRGGAAAKL